MRARFLMLAVGWMLSGCSNSGGSPSAAAPVCGAYFDDPGGDGVRNGGVKLISIDTPKGKFKVWTKRVGNNPTIKVLLLHGGPGATHEYMEVFDSYFPGAGI
ncbi:MAG TPA: hypothetical protein VNO21_16335, partial [Polyangiaceae bacterium]|nr:hypothetical protein [Polyangiaceae bacterium]